MEVRGLVEIVRDVNFEVDVTRQFVAERNLLVRRTLGRVVVALLKTRFSLSSKWLQKCFVLDAPWSTRGSTAPAVFRSSPAFRIGPKQLGHVGFALTGGILLLLLLPWRSTLLGPCWPSSE